MGTVFSFAFNEPATAGVLRDVEAELDRIDRVFSTYRADSEISRIARGELRLDAAGAQVRAIGQLCALAHDITGGCFDAYYAGPFDPTGLVKGWAIERASERLTRAGACNHGINGGGDMQLAGESWRVGISDPFDPSSLLTVVEGSDFALSTSGTAERAAHIIDPRTGAPPEALSAVSVIGSRLSRVDAYATAAFAMGDGAPAWLEAQPGVEGLVVGRDGTTVATSGFYASGSVMTKVAPPPAVA